MLALALAMLLVAAGPGLGALGLLAAVHPAILVAVGAAAFAVLLVPALLVLALLLPALLVLAMMLLALLVLSMLASLGLVLLVLVMANTRKPQISKGLWALLLALTVANVCVAVFWSSAHA